MRDFKDLEIAFAYLQTRMVEADHYAEKGLYHGAEIGAEHARRLLGTYQDAVGSFPAWPELAERTKQERVEQGYTENDPLYRRGDLRASIEAEGHGREAAFGSTSDIAADQEFGTSRGIPPRPFLGPSGFVCAEQIAQEVANAVHAALEGRPYAPAVPVPVGEDLPF